jgi:hypothetical protein
MSIEDIIRCLQEDRVIAERERRRARIEAAFAQARTVERRRFGRPTEINPALYGRRKDDKLQVVDAVVVRFKQMIAEAADPEVELVEPTPVTKPRPPLSQLAQPILAQCEATGMPHRRNYSAACWDIGSALVVDDVSELFDAALVALGYQPQKPPDEPSLKTCLSAEPGKPSVWKRNIFRKVAR